MLLQTIKNGTTNITLTTTTVSSYTVPILCTQKRCAKRKTA